MFLTFDIYISVYTVDKAELKQNGTVEPVLRMESDTSFQNGITW